MNETFVKVFVEEREMTVMLVVDLSASERFGTRRAAKVRVASEVARAARVQRDPQQRPRRPHPRDRPGRAHRGPRRRARSTSCASCARSSASSPAAAGKRAGARARAATGAASAGRGTNLKAALEALVRVSRRQSVAFIVSDFYDTGYERALALASAKHDVVPVVLADPRDDELPDVGLATLRGPRERREHRRRHERRRASARGTPPR